MEGTLWTGGGGDFVDLGGVSLLINGRWVSPCLGVFYSNFLISPYFFLFLTCGVFRCRLYHLVFIMVFLSLIQLVYFKSLFFKISPERLLSIDHDFVGLR